MGVEKTHRDSRLSKSNSVDLYRPPALRNQSGDVTTDTRGSPMAVTPNFSLSIESSTTPVTGNSSSSAITATTSISCTNSPILTNENEHFDKAVTSKNVEPITTETATTTPKAAVAATAEVGAGAQQGAATTETATSTSTAAQVTTNGQQRQQTTRRERRPDRAVYIPRARRSQTTPPTTTAATATVAIPVVTSAIAIQSQTTMQYQNAGSGGCAGCGGGSSGNQQQLAIASNTTALVSTAQSPKADEMNCKIVSKKSRTGHKERKERSSKKSPSLGVEAQITNVSKLNEKTERTKIIQNNQNCDSYQQHEGEVQSSQNQPSIAQLTLQQSEEQRNVVEAEKKNPIPTEIILANKMNSANSNSSSDVNVVDTMPNLRIEDVAASNENARSTPKCDIDEELMQRTSKEINRSNRRIIKQTFVSDVLEIPEKIETQTNSENIKAHVPASSSVSLNTTATATPTAMTADSTTEEEEEDDWESMFDENGDCLDPKIMQELTSSVGKVKIELPKMDYTAYLTKQTILNEEEFPHVLEVSNFPVEFKNQDLLMVFSQYKESGFDIKWVDDTHALAVFSSSRIAAEALTMGHPFVVLKPLTEATVESRLKAKKCAASLQPYRPRPETCAALARRLVTGALGVRLKTAPAERERERRVLREAKERKLLAAKQRDEVWES